MPVFGQGADTHRAGHVAVFYRIVNQVGHSLFEQGGVDGRVQVRVALDLQLHLLFLGFVAAQLHGAVHGVTQPVGFQLDADLALPFFDAGQREQVAKNSVEAVGLFGHDFNEVPRVVRVVERAVQQGLDKALDRGDRCAQFMRHVGHKIAPHLLEPAKPRHVVHHNHRADAVTL